MKSFEKGFLAKQPISQTVLQSVRQLGEFKGREDLYRLQAPQVLESLRQVAIIQSTESSNRIEGITAPLAKIRDLVAERTTPKNRSEQEITGYRDVLSTLHQNYADMPFTASLVLQLHRDLYRHTGERGGRWKHAENEITEMLPDGQRRVRFKTVPMAAVPDAMKTLHDGLRGPWRDGSVEKLLLIPAYVLDFLCIHPFADGNGRMARLLSLLLLYQAGFTVGRYISLERVVEESRDTYYEALQASSRRWHEGKHDIAPWTEYFLGTVLAAYKEMEQRVGILHTARGAKRSLLLDAIAHKYGDFSVAELQESCPTVGLDLIRKVLHEEGKAGRLRCLGRGPKARWRRI
jgi:Fic family protein